jgi:hypothetical protein
MVSRTGNDTSHACEPWHIPLGDHSDLTILSIGQLGQVLSSARRLLYNTGIAFLLRSSANM